MLHEYKGKWPKLGERVYIAEGAHVIGDVEIGDHSSVWYNCVIRGDVDMVRIGQHTNIQDGSIGHVMKNECPLILRDYVTIGHGVMLHGCTVEDTCLIGMASVILNNARIGRGSIIAAGTVIPENAVIEANSLVAGVPGKIRRKLKREDEEMILRYARNYLDYIQVYLNERRLSAL